LKLKNHLRHLNRSGFTLVEVLIATGISTCLILVAVSQNLSLVQSQFNSVARSNLAQDSITIANFFARQFGQAGGGSVRPWMSTFLENDCAARGAFPDCSGSDRLTLVSAVVPANECMVSNQLNPTSIEVKPSGVCCLTPTFPTGPYMLTLGSNYSQIFVTGVDLPTCSLTYQPGQASLNDLPPAIPNWTAGFLTPVTVETIFLDGVSNQARVFSDLNNNGIVDSGELNILADQVLDLQFALGIDLYGNGNITDNSDSADSYLYNSPGESWAVTMPSANSSMIRMIEVGLITGSPLNGGTLARIPQVQIFDGPVRNVTNWETKKIVLKFAPRNDFIYK
jgi:Tfp pilus assembly protein PilE